MVEIRDNINMKFFGLIFSLFLPGGSLVFAGLYKTATTIPLIGVLWVFLCSYFRWVITPEGFVLMLCGLLTLHVSSFLFGLVKALSFNNKGSLFNNFSLIILFTLNLVITFACHQHKAKLFGFAFYHIPSVSMQPTLQVGDVIVVDTWNKKVNIQDIVVTKITAKSLVLVKRVSNTQKGSNGKELFILGDNRHRSTDSRKFGWIPAHYLIGKVQFIWFNFKKARWFKTIQ